MPALLVLLALGTLGALALVSSAAAPSPTRSPRPPPDRRQGRMGKGALVSFTTVSVPWMRRNKKTSVIEQAKDKGGKPLTRTQVAETPAELAAAASRKLGEPVDVATFVLASMIASEAGKGPLLAKVAVAHTARNAAAAQGKHLVELLAPDGTLGSQQGRYASTRRPPSEEDILTARAVIEKRVPDPTGGAVQFDSPKAQRQGVKEGWAGYTSDDRQIAERRERAGKVAVFLPGLDPDEHRFWKIGA